MSIAFITQTWELALDQFSPSSSIQLPTFPLQTVTSVKYFDVDSTEATLASSNYEVDTYQEPGQIVLSTSGSWPSTTLRTVNGVVVRYVVGYGDAAADVPEMYKRAIKMVGAEMYENREMGVTGTVYTEMPIIKQLLGYEQDVRV